MENAQPVASEPVGAESLESSESSDQDSGESQETKAEAKRKLKIKIDGEFVEVDEDEVVRDYGKGKAADKKFQEAAALRKEAISFIEALKRDPVSVLTNPKLGINLREIAETHLLQILEDEMMDPKDKEIRDLKRDKEKRDKDEQARKERQEAEELEAYTQKAREEYERSFQECLASSGLPKTPHTVKRLAYYMSKGLERGLNLQPSDVVHKVKAEYLEEQKSLFSDLDGENLLQLLGDDLAKKIRKYDTSRVIRPQTASPLDQPKASGQASRRPEKITKDDWRAKMDRIKQGIE